MSAPATETPGQETAAPATTTAPASPFAPLRAVAPTEGASIPTPPAVTAPGWAEGATPDEVAYLGTKGWDKEGRGALDVLRSYRNLEKLKGADADRLVKLPDWSKPEEVAEWRSRIGVPEAPDKYENHEVKVGNGVLDAAAIAKLSHRIGANQMQHAELLTGTGELLAEIFKTEGEAQARRQEVARQELEKEVGPQNLATFNQDFLTARERFKDYLSDDLLDVVETTAEVPFRKLMSAIGKAMREGTRAVDGPGAHYGPPTAASAQAEIEMLQKDKEFFAKLQSGDTQARQRWNDLLTIAHGPS